MGIASDHESAWGQRFVKLAGKTEPGGKPYHVFLSEAGTVGDTRPGVLVSGSAAELDRNQARVLSELLRHYADTGRLPPPLEKRS